MSIEPAGLPREQDYAMAQNNGFDLGDIGEVVSDPVSGKGFDPDALQGLWEQIQPTLAGLDTDQILDTIGTWAKDLDVPLVKDVPDDVIDNIKNGAKVPLKSLIADK
ncbi:hypothetical protein [Microcella pacifica]|uniref:Uncharacterized protein n=1 Tax=Microcella pacifica TaxID=2591847 RepID=A0A9E5MI51_9MICO|nr:hypothetical protein [Microcella pacifica]NHF62328.1 hypothetical protein [Microcella pacifica]